MQHSSLWDLIETHKEIEVLLKCLLSKSQLKQNLITFWLSFQLGLTKLGRRFLAISKVSNPGKEIA
jgi:hypothetical protein